MALALSISGATAGQADVDAYLEEYRCDVLVRLLAIHSVQPRGEDRFLILGLKHHPHAYVQCLMLENDTQVLCEAASGYWSVPDGVAAISVVPPDRIEALGALGFSTDGSEGNYQKMVTIPDRDFTPVADLMLLSLFHGYGVQTPWLSVDVDAPIIGQEKAHFRLCEVPVS